MQNVEGLKAAFRRGDYDGWVDMSGMGMEKLRKSTDAVCIKVYLEEQKQNNQGTTKHK